MSGGMTGSSGNFLGQMLARGVAPTQNTGASFTLVSPNVYTPAFSSAQSGQAPAMAQPAPNQQVQQAGLQALMANMMSQLYNVPGSMAMPQQMNMPAYQNPALSYRPNMQAVQQNLSRVQPSVYKTDLDTARERISQLEAAQQPQDTGYYGGGG
jgi:hypothetical protein